VRDNYTQTIAVTALETIRKWHAAAPGRTKVLAGLLWARTGKEFHRNTISRWMRSGGEQPSLGIGLVLIEIGKELTKRKRR